MQPRSQARVLDLLTPGTGEQQVHLGCLGDAVDELRVALPPVASPQVADDELVDGQLEARTGSRPLGLRGGRLRRRPGVHQDTLRGRCPIEGRELVAEPLGAEQHLSGSREATQVVAFGADDDLLLGAVCGGPEGVDPRHAP